MVVLPAIAIWITHASVGLPIGASSMLFVFAYDVDLLSDDSLLRFIFAPHGMGNTRSSAHAHAVVDLLQLPSNGGLPYGSLVICYRAPSSARSPAMGF
eukprot:s3196_g14.t1